MCSLTGPGGNYRAPGLTPLKAKIPWTWCRGGALPAITFPLHGQFSEMPGGTLFLEESSPQSSASSAKGQGTSQTHSKQPQGCRISPELLLFNRQRLLWHLHVACP